MRRWFVERSRVPAAVRAKYRPPPSVGADMSKKAKLLVVLAVVVLAYILFSGDTEPVEVNVDE